MPRDLETICLKCLDKDAGRRYPTAQELAAELDRFLRDEPIQARPLRAPAKVLRWCRRKPALALATGAALALLLFVVIGSPIAIVRINNERKLAQAAEQRTEQQLHTALLEQARATVLTAEAGHRVRAINALRQAGAISNTAALRGVALAALALPDLRFEWEWATAAGTTLVNLDPAFGRVALCRSGEPVEIRSVADQRVLVTLPASTNLAAYVGLWSPEGRFFAVSRDHDTAGRTKDVEVWEVASAKQVLRVRSAPWGAMSFHPRLPRIMISNPDAAVIWDLETGQEVTRHALKGRPVVLKFAPEGEAFVALSESAGGWLVAVHDITNGAMRANHLFTDFVRELDWHPAGHWIAVPDYSGAVHWMDAQTGETRVLGRHKAAAVLTHFSPDGKYLFSRGWDAQVICWDVRAMRRAFVVGISSSFMQFSNDGTQCALVLAPDKQLRFHTFERPTLGREFPEDLRLGWANNHAAFSRDGRWLAVSSGLRLVVWDLQRQAAGTAVNLIEDAYVHFADNGELFVERPGDCQRWRVKPGANGAAPVLERLEMAKPAGFISLSVVSNGVIFTTTRGSKLVGFVQLATEPGDWKPSADRSEGRNGVSADERWLGMYPSFTTYFSLQRLPGFEPVARFTNQARVVGFEFSPRGEEVAIFTRTGIEFWSTETFQRTRRLTGFSDLLYSPDPRMFWLSRIFLSAGLHDARTAELLLPLPQGTQPLALSPDGRHFAVGVDSRHVQVWNLVEVRKQLRAIGLDWDDAQLAGQTAGQ
jgi:WD40 repeat protein